jgi:hypothetical protein
MAQSMPAKNNRFLFIAHTSERTSSPAPLDCKPNISAPRFSNEYVKGVAMSALGVRASETIQAGQSCMALFAWLDSPFPAMLKALQ